MKASPQFDSIARPYRWLEYLTFGRLLEKCRFHFLTRVCLQKRALALGDGDGRFLAQLYKNNPTLQGDAVDISPKMLNLLVSRVAALPGSEATLNTHCLDATKKLPEGTFDLVITHFFFDCLKQGQVDELIDRVARKTETGAIWLVSEFQIPKTGARYFAKVLIGALYLGFRILCGLRVKEVPDYRSALLRAGFKEMESKEFLFGALSTQIWRKQAGKSVK